MREDKTPVYSVLIVDDHPMIRDIIRIACEERPALTVVGEAGDGREAVERYLELRPDVVVLDLVMPGIEGLEVARQLREADPEARILILSGRDDRATIFECLRIGVRGYQEKSTPVDEIAAAIEAVAAGTRVFSVELERGALSHLGDVARQARETARAARLTPRERQVMQLIAQGLSTRQIASNLGVSERTAETHISNLYHKLEVRTRVQALHRAAGLGLVNLG
jgi:DNA-binding NarL/FixJ family response regulator